jgi:hypothetical protein
MQKQAQQPPAPQDHIDPIAPLPFLQDTLASGNVGVSLSEALAYHGQQRAPVRDHIKTAHITRVYNHALMFTSPYFKLLFFFLLTAWPNEKGAFV